MGTTSNKEAKLHLLAAYVYGLGGGTPPAAPAAEAPAAPAAEAPAADGATAVEAGATEAPAKP